MDGPINLEWKECESIIHDHKVHDVLWPLDDNSGVGECTG